MKSKLGLMAVFIITLMALTGIATALPVDITEVKIDGSRVTETDTNSLGLERGQDFEVRVELSSQQDVEDVEMQVSLWGYEYNDKERISDYSETFDLEAGVREIEKFNLRLPQKLDRTEYDLKILVGGKTGDVDSHTYRLKIQVPEHSMYIKDVVLSPEDTVKAGRALLGTVRVKNSGEGDEEGVKIKMSVPALGISAVDYVDEIESEDTVTSEELYLRIPNDALAGEYVVKTEIIFDEGYEVESKESIISIVGGTAPAAKDTAKTIISVGSQSQDVAKGSSGVVFPLTISNTGAESKTFTIGVDGAAEWASTKITPSNTIVLEGGEAKAVYIYVAANEAATAGEHMFSATIMAGDETLKQIPLTANVVEDGNESGWGKIRKVLEVGLIILVVLLVILGLIIGFSKIKGDDDDDDDLGDGSQTYY